MSGAEEKTGDRSLWTVQILQQFWNNFDMCLCFPFVEVSILGLKDRNWSDTLVSQGEMWCNILSDSEIPVIVIKGYLAAMTWLKTRLWLCWLAIDVYWRHITQVTTTLFVPQTCLPAMELMLGVGVVPDTFERILAFKLRWEWSRAGCSLSYDGSPTTWGWVLSQRGSREATPCRDTGRDKSL